MNPGLLSVELLWRNALAAIPLALAVALICRCLPCRPATRHALWLTVLLSLLAPPMLPALDLSDRLTSAISMPANSPGSSPSVQFAKSPTSDQQTNRLPTDADTQTAALATRGSAADASRSARATATDSASNAAPRVASGAILDHQSAGVSHDQSSSGKQIDPVAEQRQITEESLASKRDDSSFAAGAMSPQHASEEAISPAQSELAAANIGVVEPQASSGRVMPPHSSAKRTVSVGSPAASIADQWREWLAQFLTVRDAIVQVSPIPGTLWLAGSVVVILLLLVRIWRFQHVLRHAVPAPNDVLRMVAEASRDLGLRMAPITRMVPQRISPLIWCGRRRLLLLPQALWAELDDVGRRAVLLHELAHLRRRDHLVCWVELVVAAVYWWHPLAWWVRRKLRDEADHCCDAWVTAILPKGRSAYARALLATRRYLDADAHAAPAVGLGVTTVQAKRFARRLTMVMTERSRPRLSALGGVLVLGLAAGAWLSTPLWACPPEKDDASQSPRVGVIVRAPKAAKPRVPSAVITAPAPAGPSEPDGTTFDQYMSGRGQVGFAPGVLGDDEHLRQRINELESRLERLSEHLEQLIDGQGHKPRGHGVERRGLAPSHPGLSEHGGRPHARGMAPSAPVPPASPVPPTPPGPPTPPASPMPPMMAVPLAPPAPAAPSGAGGRQHGVRGFAFTPSDQDSELVFRLYHLPEGKLAAMTELMVREDVPVLVELRADALGVHATPRQHEILTAFIRLIHPEFSVAAGESRGAGRVKAMRQEIAALARAYERAATAGMAHGHARPGQAEAFRRALEAHRREIEQRSRNLHRRAEELHRKARELQSRSEAINSEAEQEVGEARKQLVKLAQALAAEASEIEFEADASAVQAAALEDQVVAMVEDAIAQVEAKVADLDLSEVEEAIAIDAAEIENAVKQAVMEAQEASDAAAESDNDGQ